MQDTTRCEQTNPWKQQWDGKWKLTKSEACPASAGPVVLSWHLCTPVTAFPTLNFTILNFVFWCIPWPYIIYASSIMAAEQFWIEWYFPSKTKSVTCSQTRDVLPRVKYICSALSLYFLFLNHSTCQPLSNASTHHVSNMLQ